MTGNYLIPRFSTFPHIKDEFFRPFESLFDSMITDFISDVKPMKFDAIKSRAFPRIDAFRDGQDLVIEASVSDVKPENLKVELNDGVLTLSGSIDSRQEIEGRCYYHTELFKSSFRRSFPIDEDLYKEWIKRTNGETSTDAELKNGMLTITLKGIFKEAVEPKLSPTKQINIKVVDS